MRLYHQRATYSKLFSDGVYGGEKESLEAAQKYQKKLAKEVGAPDPSAGRRKRQARLSTNRTSNTGVVGVYRGKAVSKSGATREYFAVSWNPEPNKVKSTSFSIAKYGEKEAFRLACELRQKMVKKILGYAPDDEPTEHRYISADSVVAEKRDKKDKKDKKGKKKKKKD